MIVLLIVFNLSIKTNTKPKVYGGIMHHLVQILRVNETKLKSQIDDVIIHHFRCKGEHWCLEGHNNIHRKMCRVMNKFRHNIDDENIIGKIDSDTLLNWDFYTKIKRDIDKQFKLRKRLVVGKVWSLLSGETFISGPFYLTNFMPEQDCTVVNGYDDILTWVNRISMYELLDVGHLYFGSGYVSVFNKNCKWLVKHKVMPDELNYTSCVDHRSVSIML